MSSCMSVNIFGDGMMTHIVRCLCGKGYIRNLTKNLQDLEGEMEELNAIQCEVQNKIARETRAGDRQTLEIIPIWFERVDSINARYKCELVSDNLNQLQSLCLFDKCSKNLSIYKYGKKIYLLLEEAKKLKSIGKFEEVSWSAPRYVVEDAKKLISEDNFAEVSGPAPRYVLEEAKKLISEDNITEVSGSAPRSFLVERSNESTTGQEKMLKTAWNRLMEDGVRIMGLHGIGGVGKTTIFKEIHNNFIGMAGRFDIVIWVVVSHGAEISKLQDNIAKRLNLYCESWRDKHESDKAEEIYNDLKNKRFVLMLDDAWEKVDLEAIKVPFPTRENGCKVAFTTRSLKVLLES